MKYKFIYPKYDAIDTLFKNTNKNISSYQL